MNSYPIAPSSFSNFSTATTSPQELWMQYNLDYRMLCDENHCNKGIRIRQEFQEYARDAQRQECIANARNCLRNVSPRPLYDYFITCMEFNDFPSVIRDMALYLEQRTGLDAVGVILTILAITSVSCCGRVKIEIIPDKIQSYFQPFILQVLCMAESGSKKSELHGILCEPIANVLSGLNIDDGLNHIKNSISKKYAEKAFKKKGDAKFTAMFDEIDGDWTEENINAFQDAIEKHVEVQKMVLDKYIQSPRKTAYLDNVTLARAYECAFENGECLNFVSDEADIMTKIMHRNNDEFRKFIMRGFDQKEFFVENIRKKYNFRRPSVSMCILTQPKTARRLYECDYIRDLGLTERIIPWLFRNVSDPICSTREKISSDVIELYNIKIKSLFNLFYTQDRNATQYTIKIAPCILSKVNNYLKNIQNDAKYVAYGRGWHAKSAAQAVRLACAIHFWNTDRPLDMPINDAEMRMGVRLINTINLHADLLFSPLGLRAIDAANKILKSLSRIEFPARDEILRRGITSTDIKNRTGLKREDVVYALDLLASTNHIALLDEGKKYVTVILPQ